MKGFLIDECLSPWLAAIARDHGIDAVSLRDVQMLSHADESVAAFALKRDLVIVTYNALDFLRIYRNLDNHPGLALILSANTRSMQVRAFSSLLESVDFTRPLRNVVWTIERDGAIRRCDRP